MSDRTVIRDRLLADTTEGLPRPGERVLLDASRCVACESIEFPGRDQCPTCGAVALSSPVGPTATLVGFTSVLHPAPGSLVEPPYHIGVARFTEGLEVIGLLDVNDRESVLGHSLTCVAVEAVGGVLTYGFRLTESSEPDPGGAFHQ